VAASWQPPGTPERWVISDALAMAKKAQKGGVRRREFHVSFQNTPEIQGIYVMRGGG